MNGPRTLLLFGLLIAPLTGAEVYRWVDDSGQVHFGNDPASLEKGEVVKLPENPSPDRDEQARRNMQERVLRMEATAQEIAAGSIAGETEEPLSAKVSDPGFRISATIACGDPLSDLLGTASSNSHSPIVPTELSADQQDRLRSLLRRLGAQHSGSLQARDCEKGGDRPDDVTTTGPVHARVTWDALQSRLLIDSEVPETADGVATRVYLRLLLGEALYYSDGAADEFSAADDNRVELLQLTRDRVAFMIRRNISTGPGTRTVRTEIRQLEKSGDTLTLTELFYHLSILTGSRIWVLES